MPMPATLQPAQPKRPRACDFLGTVLLAVVRRLTGHSAKRLRLNDQRRLVHRFSASTTSLQRKTASCALLVA